MIVPQENVRYLEQQMDFVFDPRRKAWVKDSAGRIWVISYEEASDHDLAWLKTKVAELARQPL